MSGIVSATLSKRIVKELRQRDMTVTDFVTGLATKYGHEVKIPHYNHIRRICTGEAYPGPRLLPTVCDFLGIEVEEARRLMRMDKAMNSGVVGEITNNDEQFLQLGIFWKHLNQNSKNELLMLAQMKSQVDTSK